MWRNSCTLRRAPAISNTRVAVALLCRRRAKSSTSRAVIAPKMRPTAMVVPRLSSVNRRSNVGRDGRGNGIDIGVRQKMEQPACQGSAKPHEPASPSPVLSGRSRGDFLEAGAYGDLAGTITVTLAVV